MPGRILSIVPVVLLSLAASACTAGTSPIDTRSAAAPPVTVQGVDTGNGADIGNGRPVVTFDGPMVRRRAVLAVAGTGADAPAVRAALESAAARLGLDLADVPPTVLGARDLEDGMPELTLALPEGRTIADGRALIDACSESAGRPAATISVAAVLLHDLAFTMAVSDPGTVAGLLDAEGILADVLGGYDVERSEGELTVGYTGPLLSDVSVRAVRLGMARAADADPSAVRVSSRSSTGQGVQLPAWPEPAAAGAGRTSAVHGHGAGLAALTDGSGEGAAPSGDPFLPVAGGLAVAWATLLVVLARRRARASASPPGDG